MRKSEGKRPLGRSRRRLGNNIKIEIKGLEWEGVDRMHVAQGRDNWRALVNWVMKFG